MTRSNGADHDDNTDDGPEPGEWTVVATENGDAAEADK